MSRSEKNIISENLGLYRRFDFEDAEVLLVLSTYAHTHVHMHTCTHTSSHGCNTRRPACLPARPLTRLSVCLSVHACIHSFVCSIPSIDGYWQVCARWNSGAAHPSGRQPDDQYPCTGVGHEIDIALHRIRHTHARVRTYAGTQVATGVGSGSQPLPWRMAALRSRLTSDHRASARHRRMPFAVDATHGWRHVLGRWWRS